MPDDNGGNIPKKVLQDLKQKYTEEGFKGIIEGVEHHLKEWNNIPLNIAVFGSSGSGKSSFINAIRGLTADDEGVAEVGVTETTKEPTYYSHPDNPSLKLWDLPEVGTPNFPKDKYLQQVEFERFDFFLILTCDQFTEDDLWLAKQVQKLQKRFYFLRTKVDLDINNDRKAHPETHNKSSVLDEIKRKTVKQLQDNGFEATKIFLINSFETTALDFGSLSACLIKDSPEFKKEALALSLSSLSEDVIREKANVLKNRIYKMAIISALARAAPVRGLGILVDTGVMLKEVAFYRKQLGLDDSSVQAYAAALYTTKDELIRSLSLNIGTVSFTHHGLMSSFARIGPSSTTAEILRVAVPPIGPLLASGFSYGTQVVCMQRLLDLLVEDAMKISRKLASAFVLKSKM